MTWWKLDLRYPIAPRSKARQIPFHSHSSYVMIRPDDATPAASAASPHPPAAAASSSKFGLAATCSISHPKIGTRCETSFLQLLILDLVHDTSNCNLLTESKFGVATENSGQHVLLIVANPKAWSIKNSWPLERSLKNLSNATLLVSLALFV